MGNSTIPPAAGAKWFYTNSGQQFGPIDAASLKLLMAHGRIAPDDHVWSEGMPDWIPAAHVLSLIDPSPASDSGGATQSIRSGGAKVENHKSKIPAPSAIRRVPEIPARRDLPPSDHSLPPDAAIPVAAQRRKHRAITPLNLVMHVVASFAGLAIGYFILCQFGEKYDFLHIMHRAQPPNQIEVAAGQLASEQPLPAKPAAGNTAKPADGNTAKPAASNPAKPTDVIPKKPSPIAEPNQLAGNAALPTETTIPPADKPKSTPEKSGGLQIIGAHPTNSPTNDKPADPLKTSDAPAADPPKTEESEKQPATPQPPPVAGTDFHTAAEIEAQAQRQRSAKASLRLYTEFLTNATLAEDDRKTAESRLKNWDTRASKDMVRLGTLWLAPDAAEKAITAAKASITRALELEAAAQPEAARRELDKASSSDPESATADFLAGILYSLEDRNYQKARSHFTACNQRAPDDFAALNNLALVSVLSGDHRSAVNSFRAALAIEPASQEIKHNLQRLLTQANLKNLTISPALLTEYETLFTRSKFDTAKIEAGWLYLPPAPSTDPTAARSDLFDRLRDLPAGNLVAISPSMIEDRACMTCRGAHSLPCPNCRGKGTIGVPQQKKVGTNPLTGQPSYVPTTIQENCPTCRGKGTIDCPNCFDGRDRSLPATFVPRRTLLQNRGAGIAN
jgi:Flp pilus assembly protein TadD